MMETATEQFIVLDDNTKIDVHNYCLETQSGTVSFTKREIQLLEYLHRHQHQTLSREALLYEVWGYRKELEIETRTVDIHIARLRRKIEQDHKSPKFLLTVRGAGYRLLSRQQA
jgi:two-component system response regulator RegX3